MLTERQKLYKRVFDVTFSILLLPFVIFPLILLLLFATIDTRRSGLFIQQRVGYKGKLFNVYKIRTLIGTGHETSIEIKKSETIFGRWLRRNKLDELPQIFNVLLGEMSWVGPRPDVVGYADTLTGDDGIILAIRPGITGPATIKYKDEEAVLLTQLDPRLYNDTVIWPDKVKINKEYIKNWSFAKDLKYLWASVF